MLIIRILGTVYGIAELGECLLCASRKCLSLTTYLLAADLIKGNLKL